MGVQGLWQLLDPLGRPVSLESLENKILAIDASIWLHQSVHGFRDKANNPLPNAHLLGLFHRVCKLLFYGIKPVFVFDGTVPFLKRQTMAKRRDRQQNASKEAEKTYHQILHKYIQSKAIKEALGKQDAKNADATSGLSEIMPKNKTTDIYDLPPMPSTSEAEIAAPHLNENSDDENDDFEDDFMSSRISAYQDVDSIDFEAENFKSLPLDIQHELLVEMKERNKRHYWIHHEPLPENAEEIGNFQIKQLLLRRKLQRKIESINKDLSASLTGQLASEQGFETFGTHHVLESQRISSEDSAHYILFKSIPNKESSLPSTTTGNAGSKNILKSNMENPVTASRNLWLKSISAPTARNKLYTKNSETTSKNVVDASVSIALAISSVNENEDQTCLPSGVSVNDSPSTDENHKMEWNAAVVFDKFNDLKNEHTLTIEDVPKESASVDSTSDVVPNESISVDSASSVVPNESISVDSASDVVPNESISVDSATTIPKLEITKKESGVVKSCLPEPLLEDNGSVLLDMKDSAVSYYKKTAQNTGVAVNGLIFKDSQNQAPLNPVSLHTLDDSPVVTIMSSSEDSDDDFIEVEINPEKIEEDELFPLEVFKTSNTDVDSKTNVPESSDQNDMHEDIEKLPTLPEFEIVPPRDRTDLLLLSEELDRQTEVLVQDKGRQERIAATITEQMYNESQELLKLFGIPFVISPAEAEAQCAKMDELDLTDGTITDDSDVWLFGARKVYKNFFENKRDVLCFSQADVLNRLRLDRSKLIAVAMLTGSDYTEGIRGVGIVTALEILAEFKEDDGFASLRKLSGWWKVSQEQKVAPSETKVKQKLRKLALGEGFPNSDVLKAYLEPLVDSSKEGFSWARPDLDALRRFASAKLNWAQEKTDGMILPIIKRLNTAKERQIRIDSFFPAAPRSGQAVKHQSRRLNRALKKVGSHDDSQGVSGVGQPKKSRQASRARGPARKKNLPKIPENAMDLGLSESSDSSSPDEEWSGQPLKRKPLPLKKG